MADSSILDFLNIISKARYGREVRGAIVDAISQCYQDGKAGVTDLDARKLIEQAIKVNEDQQSDISGLDARVAELESSEGGGSQQETTITLDTVVADGGYVNSVSVNNNATATYDVTFSQTFTEPPQVMVCTAVQTTASAVYGNVSVGIVKSQLTKTGFRFWIANKSGASRSTTVVWMAMQPVQKTINLDITVPSGTGMTEAQVRAITDPIQNEVDGIETGYDGETYQTAGGAVRTQIAALWAEINRLKAQVEG